MAASSMDLEPLVGHRPDEEAAGALESASPSPVAHRSWRRGLKLAAAGSVAAALLLAAVKMQGGPAHKESPALRAGLLQTYDDAIRTLGAAMQYNETVATAMAVLGKVAYCDGKPGMYGSAAYSCGKTGLPGVQTPCEQAGFVVVPGTVRVFKAPETLAYVASLQLLDPKLATVKGYALVFRGSLNNTLEVERDSNNTLVPLSGLANTSHCPNARVHAGFQSTWSTLRRNVVAELQQQGAFVTCTGHGSGAALCSYAMLDLKVSGYQVMSSYVYSMPAPGNDAFANCFNKAFGGLTPFFRLTHAADRACDIPEGYAPVGAEVHYPGLARGQFNVCRDGDAKCGCAKLPKDTKWSGNATCQSAVAPEGSFCNFESFRSTCYGGTGFQWPSFGPSMGGKPQPAAQGLARLEVAVTGIASAADKPSSTQKPATSSITGSSTTIKPASASATSSSSTSTPSAKSATTVSTTTTRSAAKKPLASLLGLLGHASSR